MEPFIKATYKLEGDGLLSLEAYEPLSILLPLCLPSITQMLLLWQRLKQMEMLHMSNNSKACVQPAYKDFYLKFNNDLKPVLDAFKAAHLFSPFKFHELKPSATDIDCLKHSYF